MATQHGKHFCGLTKARHPTRILALIPRLRKDSLLLRWRSKAPCSRRRALFWPSSLAHPGPACASRAKSSAASAGSAGTLAPSRVPRGVSYLLHVSSSLPSGPPAAAAAQPDSGVVSTSTAVFGTVHSTSRRTAPRAEKRFFASAGPPQRVSDSIPAPHEASDAAADRNRRAQSPTLRGPLNRSSHLGGAPRSSAVAAPTRGGFPGSRTDPRHSGHGRGAGPPFRNSRTAQGQARKGSPYKASPSATARPVISSSSGSSNSTTTSPTTSGSSSLPSNSSSFRSSSSIAPGGSVDVGRNSRSPPGSPWGRPPDTPEEEEAPGEGARSTIRSASGADVGGGAGSGGGGEGGAWSLSYSQRVARLRKPALTAADKLGLKPEERARIFRELRTPRRGFVSPPPRGGAGAVWGPQAATRPGLAPSEQGPGTGTGLGGEPRAEPQLLLQLPLRVFCYGIDDVRLYRALAEADAIGLVVVVPQVAAADAVFATRTKRTGKALTLTEISNAARNAGKPFLELSAVSSMRVMEAVETLTGWPVPEHLRRRIPPPPLAFLPSLERDPYGSCEALGLLTGGLSLPEYLLARTGLNLPAALLREMDRTDLYGSRDELLPVNPQEREAVRQRPVFRPYMHGSRMARKRLLREQLQRRAEAEDVVPW